MISDKARERRTAKAAKRDKNRITFVRVRAQQAANGRELLVVACNAALAARKRITDVAQRGLAKEIAQAVERWDTTANRKETS